MSAAAKKKTAARRKSKKKDVVFGLGTTGLSVARYLARNDIDAIYLDSRETPPGLDELAEICPDAEVICGGTSEKILKKASRIIASPGIADSEPLLAAARDADIRRHQRHRAVRRRG